MSVEILPTIGRVALATKVVASKFLFAISRGDPAWDARWTSANPPTPQLDAVDVLSRIAYARPTIVDYLMEDDQGGIIGEGGARYSISPDPTRYVRVRLSLEPGSISSDTIREIGLFIDPTVDGSTTSGPIIIAPEKVVDKGRLYTLFWSEPFPIEDGTHFAINFVVRL